MKPQKASELQKAYAAKRKAWARAVGRPYTKNHDPRPPPGELDAEPDAAEE
ncbi:MAG TPA: hypothetical protein VII63_07490 [Caulobacteraceae bacterium]